MSYSSGPTPRELHAKRHDSKPLHILLGEFIDNSGHAEVGAHNIWIDCDHKNDIWEVWDDGCGVPTFEPVVRSGVGTSSADEAGGSGMYGVGAKDALTGLGSRVEYFSRRLDDTAIRLCIDFDELAEMPEYAMVDDEPIDIEDLPPQLQEHTGLMYRISGLRREQIPETRKRANLLARLADQYAWSGDFHVWVRFRDQSDDWSELRAEQLHLIDVENIGGSIKTEAGELRWTGQVGQVAASTPEKYRNIAVSLGYRQLERTRDPFGEFAGLPFSGWVRLAPEWKPYQTRHKDGLWLYRKELVETLASYLRPRLEKAKAEARLERVLAIEARGLLVDLEVILFQHPGQYGGNIPIGGGRGGGKGGRGRGTGGSRVHEGRIVDGGQHPVETPDESSGKEVKRRRRGAKIGWTAVQRPESPELVIVRLSPTSEFVPLIIEINTSSGSWPLIENNDAVVDAWVYAGIADEILTWYDMGASYHAALFAVFPWLRDVTHADWWDDDDLGGKRRQTLAGYLAEHHRQLRGEKKVSSAA